MMLIKFQILKNYNDCCPQIAIIVISMPSGALNRSWQIIAQKLLFNAFHHAFRNARIRLYTNLTSHYKCNVHNIPKVFGPQFEQ